MRIVFFKWFLVCFIILSSFEHNLCYAKDNVISAIAKGQNIFIKLPVDNLDQFKIELRDGGCEIDFVKDIKNNKVTISPLAKEKISKISFANNKKLRIDIHNQSFKCQKYKSKISKGIKIYNFEKKKDKLNKSKVEIKLNNEKQTDVQSQNEKQKHYDKITFDIEQNSFEIEFPWQEEVASAVFIRNKTLWVVFDKYKDFKIDNIPQNNFINNITKIENQIYSIMSFSLANNIELQTQKLDNNWKIILKTNDNNKNILSSEHQIQEYASEYSKGLFFDIDNKSKEKISFMDPEIGDLLEVVPVFQSNLGVRQQRSFADFVVLETAHGLALSLLSENVRLIMHPNGVDIISPGYVKSDYNSSKIVDTVSEKIVDTVSDVSSKTLVEHDFPASGNSLISIPEVNPINFLEEYQTIKHELYKQDKKINLVDIAKFYFAHGMYTETKAILDYAIDNINLNEKDKSEVALICAISHFMNSDYLIAKNVIERSKNYDNIPEYNFWKKLINLVNYNYGEKPIYNEIIEDFVNVYSSDIRYKIIEQLIIIELIDHKNINYIWFLSDQLKTNAQNKKQINSANFYKGQAAYFEQDYSKALEIWKRVSTDNNDYLNNLRSNIAIIDLLLQQEVLSKEEALHQLNHLRFRWRGGDEEEKLLNMIADLSFQTNNYIDALRAWKSMLKINNKTKDSLFILSKMGKAFTDFYEINDDDFNSVAVFFEFKELLPVGIKGDEIILKIADSMIHTGLYDKAASLLSHQITFRLKGKDKNNASMKLSKLYLDNKEYNLAIDNLEKNIDSKILSPTELDDFKLNKAQIYSLLGQPTKALDIIKFDFSNEANNLREEIYFNYQKWRGLKSLLEANLVKDSEFFIKNKLSLDKYLIACSLNKNINDIPSFVLDNILVQNLSQDSFANLILMLNNKEDISTIAENENNKYLFSYINKIKQDIIIQ